MKLANNFVDPGIIKIHSAVNVNAGADPEILEGGGVRTFESQSAAG